jgi:Peptidase family M23
MHRYMNKHRWPYCIMVILLFACGSVRPVPADVNRETALGLQKQRYAEDTSFVYWLPYRAGGKHLVVQGYYSRFSHQTDVAARGGVVSDYYEDSNIGGAKDEYLDDGNYITITHNDGSRAHYWHLKYKGVLVNPGDTVKQGQLIALSGNTGYSAFPHLHFEVWGYTPGGGYSQLPTRFLTPKGPRYLRPLRFYKAVHAPLH